MAYVLFVYDHPESLAELSDAERQAVYREYEALGPVPGLEGFRVQPSERAATLRLRDGERELLAEPFGTDGRFLAGFYLLATESFDEALELAARIPAARLGGAVELRPLAGE